MNDTDFIPAPLNTAAKVLQNETQAGQRVKVEEEEEARLTHWKRLSANVVLQVQRLVLNHSSCPRPQAFFTLFDLFFSFKTAAPHTVKCLESFPTGKSNSDHSHLKKKKKDTVCKNCTFALLALLHQLLNWLPASADRQAEWINIKLNGKSSQHPPPTHPKKKAGW